MAGVGQGALAGGGVYGPSGAPTTDQQLMAYLGLGSSLPTNFGSYGTPQGPTGATNGFLGWMGQLFNPTLQGNTGTGEPVANATASNPAIGVQGGFNPGGQLSNPGPGTTTTTAPGQQATTTMGGQPLQQGGIGSILQLLLGLGGQLGGQLGGSTGANGPLGVSPKTSPSAVQPQGGPVSSSASNAGGLSSILPILMLLGAM